MKCLEEFDSSYVKFPGCKSSSNQPFTDVTSDGSNRELRLLCITWVDQSLQELIN